jgi:hypothetical protein
MFAAVKTGDVKEVVESVIEHAKAGSVKHQQLFLDVMGLRIKQVEISTPDDQPVKTYIAVDVDKV